MSSTPPPHPSFPLRQSEHREHGPLRRRLRPVAIAILGLVVVALLLADIWLLLTRRRFEAEIARLRSSMTVLERRRADQIVSQEENKLRLAIELLRRQARLERALHLTIAIDSGVMYLERDGAVLREMPVQLGPERRVGIPPDTVRLAAPLGVRTIASVLTEQDSWDVPSWVYADRGVGEPADRVVPGALGPAALVLDGGTIIYSRPDAGPLSDPGYVLPGAVRARAEDLRAILPNLSAGVRVYFY